jgi:AhpD family alkylhydroperoxidase
METRVNIQKSQPIAIKAMYALEAYLQGTTLPKTSKELIKIRTSQINKCAFCINMHTEEALKNGETAHRIFMLSAWEETSVFTEEEKALLQFSEYITEIGEQGVPDRIYEKVKEYYNDNQIGEIIMATVIINSWNRIAITTRLQA